MLRPNQKTVFSHVMGCLPQHHQFAKCEIDKYKYGDIERYSVSEGLCVGSCRSMEYEDLKEEQVLVVSEFVGGKDVFVVLPTGY